MRPSNLVPFMTASDQQLVERLLAGDERAFRGFFNEYFDRLYRFALARTHGDVDIAEKAAQRALCRPVRRLDGYRGDASLFTWLAQICRNELADRLGTTFEAARSTLQPVRSAFRSAMAARGLDAVALGR
jgi:RNA polymerase sigma factor (sigma-70 family)